MHARQILGRQGEDLAATHLVASGHTILSRNWRPTAAEIRGELDLVVRRGRVLAFCEVKTRRSRSAGTPADAVSGDKRRRLRRLAALYLQAHPHPGPVRGDVIAIDVDGEVGDAGTVLTHLRGVW